ncbi:hypothetical protein FRC11_004159 [Ceratobasidium sp. 423]|nr:hypothetical protein FRC11_004159 [Ceratobasidium sp. 423]
MLFLGALGSFALLYTIGIIVSLIGTGFLIGFGKQLQLMFKPVRVVATIIFLATIGLVFVGAFVIRIANNPPNGGVNWNALAPAGATPGDRGYGGGYGPGPGPAYGQGGYNPNMQQGYPPPQVQQKSSSNTGAIIAAGAAGVVGGALIANALSDDDYQDGYEAGLEAAEEEN